MSNEQYDRRNRNVLRRGLKTESDDAELTSSNIKHYYSSVSRKVSNLYSVLTVNNLERARCASRRKRKSV